MSQGLAFLIWLICVGISAILIGYFITEPKIHVKKEGFMVHVCPSNTISFITDDGETQCCNGDVVDGYCTGNLRCTISPKSKSGLPTCADLAKSDLAASGLSQCPSQMPNYFSSTDGSLRGCSASLITSDGTAPSNPNQPQCILYPTQALDQVKLDSCYNALKVARDALSLSKFQSIPACSAAAAAAGAAPVNRNSSCPPAPVCPSPPPAPIQLPPAYTPKQNTILLESFTMPADYQLEFDITPTSAATGDWRNIMHFSHNKTDGSGFGSRTPAIWFVPGTLNLHVRFGDSTSSNFGFDNQPGCALNTQTHVTLRCKGKQVTLIIDSNVFKLTQPTNRYSGPVTVYGSDPWYPAATCSISSLSLQSL